MGKESKFRSAVRAIDSVEERDLGLVLGIASNLASPDRDHWRRTYLNANRTGISELSSAPVVDARPMIEAFHWAVFGQSVDASNMPVPPTDHPAVMLNPCILSFAEIVTIGGKYFNLPEPVFYKPLNEARSTSSGRPTEQYFFAHVGKIQRDMPGLSYDHVKRHDLNIMNLVEYAYATFYNKWRYGRFFDGFGWARLDALWADGRTVYGGLFGEGLYLGWGHTNNFDDDSGSRSIIIL